MASIKENKNKKGETISYRLRISPCRDAARNQKWRTKTITIAEVEEAAKQGYNRLTPAKRKSIVEGMANQWEAEERAKFKKAPTAKDKGRMTLRDFVNDVWIPNYVDDGNKSPNSAKFFKDTSRPVVAYLGDKRLNQIDTEDCTRFVTYLNTTARTERGTVPSKTSRTHYFSTLRNILRAAKRWKYITTDPTEDMTRGERPKREKKPVEFLTKDEVQKFLAALDKEPTKKRTYFHLLLVTGMRRGEAVALQWADVKPGTQTEEPQITISKNAVVDISAPSKRLIKETKTEDVRNVPITISTYNKLLELRHEIEEKMGEPVKSSAYVFPVDDDPYTCLYPSTPTQWMEKLISKHNLKKCTVHELRRTFATLALQEKFDPKTVASITGHADTATLFKFYAGTDASQQRKAVESIEKLYG